MLRNTLIFGLASLSLAFGLNNSAVQADTGGRTGPVVFDDLALDRAMSDMNQQLQLRYQQDAMLAHLDAVPSQEFSQVANAVAHAPFDQPGNVYSEFGPTVGGGRSLNLHLAAFNEDLKTRGDDLFLRVVRAEVTGFKEIASDMIRGPSEFSGQVMDDPTLDARMHDLNVGLLDFERRAQSLNPAQPFVTGTSFDQYGKAVGLLLF